MPFEKVYCTESLAAEFGLPAGLSQDKHRNPIGRTVVCDRAEKVMLIPNPLHHSTYPDRDYTLFIKGKDLLAWDIPRNGEKPHHVEVYVRKENECFGDDELIAIARQVFTCLRGLDEDAYDIPIEVRGRTPQPAAVREPQAVIAYLNKFTALAPKVGAEVFWTLAGQHFVPTLVRPCELGAFVQYGEEIGWRGLTPETCKVFGKIIERLAREHRSH